MKCGIITVTPNGVKLALALKTGLGDVTIYAKEGRCKVEDEVEVQFYNVMKDLIAHIVHEYDALIFFTSTGIAVRMLAPYLQHKVKDPAVVVVDEQGHFAISLLSGHLGGANELAQVVAGILEATPVITTATDSQGILAPDTLARKLGLTVYPLENIKIVNGALVAGEKVNYYLDGNWEEGEGLLTQLKAEGIEPMRINLEDFPQDEKAKVLFTKQRLKYGKTLCLTPRRLIAGVGCRKDVSYDLIDKALQEAKIRAGVDAPIAQLCSTVVKAQEPNLLLWAEKNKVPIMFFDNEIMGATIEAFHLEESNFVKSQIGIGNVCEASILSYNPRAKVILKKNKFEKVTVSLAWE